MFAGPFRPPSLPVSSLPILLFNCSDGSLNADGNQLQLRMFHDGILGEPLDQLGMVQDLS